MKQRSHDSGRCFVFNRHGAMLKSVYFYKSRKNVQPTDASKDVIYPSSHKSN